MQKRNRELHIRVELTGEDQHTLVVSTLDGKAYFNKDINLTFEEVIQHTKTELDSWKQVCRDEEGEGNSSRDSSQDPAALADSTRKGKG